MSSTPFWVSAQICHSIRVRGPSGSRHFGRPSVSGRRREPWPALRMTALIYSPRGEIPRNQAGNRRFGAREWWGSPHLSTQKDRRTLGHFAFPIRGLLGKGAGTNGAGRSPAPLRRTAACDDLEAEIDPGLLRPRAGAADDLQHDLGRDTRHFITWDRDRAQCRIRTGAEIE